MPLKRRAHLPGPADLDSRVTLAALLQRGSDRNRWSSGRAAALEGYIVGARDGAIEFANCLSFTDRDTHLEIAMRPDAPRSEQVIVEVTPALRAWARSNGMDWSTRAVQRLVGRKVSVAGWLLFDEQHAKQSENTRPGHPGNWRATAWELHPVTSIRPLD